MMADMETGEFELIHVLGTKCKGWRVMKCDLWLEVSIVG